MSGVIELAERMAPVCADAVDSLEVAAVLEANGVTDSIAASRYGSANVFDLAERLRRDQPPQPEAISFAASPWRAQPVRHLLRGVLFTLPAVCYLAVSHRVTGQTAAAVMVLSLLLSWTVAQGMSYLGYARLSGGDRAGAAAVLRWSLLAGGVPVIVMTGCAALVAGVPPVVAAIAVGQAGYLLAASVALVQRAEYWLLLVLLPGVVGNTGAILVGGAIWSRAAVWASAATVVATFGLALHSTRGARWGTAATRVEFIGAAPQALYGLFAGGLVVFAPAAQAFVSGAPVDAVTAAAAMLPLTASMGIAEWLLYGYRSRVHRAQQEALTLRGFGWRARGVLLAAVAAYLAVLATGTGLTAYATGAVTPSVPLAAAVALGGCLFVALMLLSCGVRAIAVAGCGLVLAAEAAATATRTAGVASIQLAACSTLFAVLLAHAMGALSRATRHR